MKNMITKIKISIGLENKVAVRVEQKDKAKKEREDTKLEDQSKWPNF